MPTKKPTIDPVMRFLTQERIRQRLTQEELANLSGINLRMLQRLEQGERNVDVPQMRRLCIALDVPLSRVVLHESIADLRQDAFQSLPSSIRNQLLSLADAIAQELGDKGR